MADIDVKGLIRRRRLLTVLTGALLLAGFVSVSRRRAQD
jgi:hypothetical protein